MSGERAGGVFWRAALLTACVVAAAGCRSRAPKPGGGEGERRRVLIYSRTAWYRHPEVPRLNGWLVNVLTAAGWEAHVSGSPKDFRPKTLARYEAIILNSTTEIGKDLEDGQKQAILDWFRAGGGLVALHGAAVHHGTWDWYADLFACDFDSDSEYVEARLVVDPGAKDHPAMKGTFPEFRYTADWHTFTKSVTGVPGVQVLFRADESSFEVVRKYFRDRGSKPMGEDHPIAWVRDFEGGRLFYTSLGHDVRSLDTPFGRLHLLGGLEWAAEQ